MNGYGTRNGGILNSDVCRSTPHITHEDGNLKQNTLAFFWQCWKQNNPGSPNWSDIFGIVYLFLKVNLRLQSHWLMLNPHATYFKRRKTRNKCFHTSYKYIMNKIRFLGWSVTRPWPECLDGKSRSSGRQGREPASHQNNDLGASTHNSFQIRKILYILFNIHFIYWVKSKNLSNHEIQFWIESK